MGLVPEQIGSILPCGISLISSWVEQTSTSFMPETPPADAQYLVESLDKLRTQTDAFAFKRIADRWYLHVDNW